MSDSISFTGYSNDVFQVCMIASTWLNSVLTTTANPYGTEQQTTNVLQTLRNGQQAVAAWQLQGAWTTELALLQEIQVLPLNLPAAAAFAFASRVSALQDGIAALQAILPAANVAQTLTLLANNQPAIAYPGVMEFYESFQFEPSPAGFTPNQIPEYADLAAANWAIIAAAALAYQTALSLSQGYDEATRIGASLNDVSAVITQLTSTPGKLTFASTGMTALQAWNQVIALPSMLRTGSSIYSSPSSPVNQQCGVIRTVLGASINALVLYMLTLRQPSTGDVNLATIRANDSLMDIAARSLGNFEQWSQIAALNGLSAPWMNQAGSQPGDTLILPSSNGTSPAAGTPVTSYAVNVLGVDWFFGNLKSNMPQWTGDIPLITGSQNLQISLIRRIMTLLNELIYHRGYGSRIPPEVGEIQDSLTASLITAFGTSAILSDPRVASVLSASTTLNATGVGLDQFQAQVQPIGISGSNGVVVNATLS